MAGKRLWVPKGVARAIIIPTTKEAPLSQTEYDQALEADYDAHRAEYVEVMLHGVPVKVKVIQLDDSELKNSSKGS